MFESDPATHSVAIVVPAKNEAGNIGRVVTDASRYGRVIVVDDGSTDSTGRIAREAGADVVRMEASVGYNGALAAGLRYALTLSVRAVGTMDGDGQHTAEMFGPMLELLGPNVSVVVGVRGRFGRWSEAVFGLVTWSVWGVRDPLCGQKVYSSALLRELDLSASYDSVGTEWLMVALRKGAGVRQINVPCSRRMGVSRFGLGIRPNLRILRALIQGLGLSRPAGVS